MMGLCHVWWFEGFYRCQSSLVHLVLQEEDRFRPSAISLAAATSLHVIAMVTQQLERNTASESIKTDVYIFTILESGRREGRVVKRCLTANVRIYVYTHAVTACNKNIR